MKYIFILLMISTVIFALSEAEQLFDEGMNQAKLKNFSEAVTCFGRALRLDPENKKYLYYCGFAYINGGNTEAGLNCFQKIADKNPDWNNIQEKIYDLMIKTYPSQLSNSLEEKKFFIPKYGLTLFKPEGWYIYHKYISFGMNPIAVICQNPIESAQFNPYASIEVKQVKINDSSASIRNYGYDYHSSIKQRFHNYELRSVKEVRCGNLHGVEIRFYETLQDVKYIYVQYFFYKNDHIFMITFHDRLKDYNFTSVFFSKIINNLSIIPIAVQKDRLISEGNLKKYLCSQGNFSVSYPQNWYLELGDTPENIAVIFPDKEVKTVSISLSRNFSFKNADNFWKNYCEVNKDITVSQSRKMDINGIPCIVSYFSIETYSGLIAVLQRGQKVFFLNFIAENKKFDEYSEVFKKILGAIAPIQADIDI